MLRSNLDLADVDGPGGTPVCLVHLLTVPAPQKGASVHLWLLLRTSLLPANFEGVSRTEANGPSFIGLVSIPPTPLLP